LTDEADAIESAVTAVLDKGYRTADIASEGTTIVGTEEMGRLICGELE
jgi:3-isopropylmalate dehydrogenase